MSAQATAQSANPLHSPPRGAPQRPRGDRVVFRADPPYVEWLERLSVALREPLPTLIDKAVVAYAGRHNFEQAPRRLAGREG